PQRRAGVHVEGQGGRAAVLAERGRDQRVGAQVRALAAKRLRHAQAEQAGVLQVRVVLEGEARFAVVFLRALGESRAERFGECDQFLLFVTQFKTGTGDGVARIDHRLWFFRKKSRASLNSSGWSMGPRWPQPCSSTYSEPGILPAIFSIIAGGAVLSSEPAISSVGTLMSASSLRRSKVVSSRTALR